MYIRYRSSNSSDDPVTGGIYGCSLSAEDGIYIPVSNSELKNNLKSAK